MRVASRPHQTLSDPRERIANMRRWNEENVGDYWQREADFWEGLIEQLEAAQQNLDSKKDELRETEARLGSLEESYRALHRQWSDLADERDRLRVMLDAILPDKTTFYVIPDDSDPAKDGK